LEQNLPRAQIFRGAFWSHAYRPMVAGGATLSSCWGRWDRLAGASDVAPRRFSRSPARRAKDSSPVRQHWENDGPASAPGPGGTTGEPVPLFRPVPGLANAACLLPTAMRRGLLSVALRALRTTHLRLAAMWGRSLTCAAVGRLPIGRRFTICSTKAVLVVTISW
jgi:hypothetical protein